MLEALVGTKLRRTIVLSAVAGLVALVAFAVVDAVGGRGLVRTVVAVMAGLAVALALENALAPPD